MKSRFHFKRLIKSSDLTFIMCILYVLCSICDAQEQQNNTKGEKVSLQGGSGYLEKRKQFRSKREGSSQYQHKHRASISGVHHMAYHHLIYFNLKQGKAALFI